MEIDDLSAKANDAYVDEEYETALKLYTEAISQKKDDPKLHLKRAQAYMKLNKRSEAEADCRHAVELDPANITAYVRHGTVLLQLERFEEAYAVCEKGLSTSGDHKQLQELLEKCQDKLPAKKPSEPEPQTTEESDVTPAAEPAEPAQPVEPVPMPPPKVKHDYYQTETHVIITILLRQAKSEDLDMNVTPFTLSVSVKRENGGCYSLELDLAHEVLPQQCTSRVSPAKIELKLRKKEGVHWSKLEGEAQHQSTTAMATADSSAVHKYPTSRHTTKDWDKMAAEIKDEDEGDPLNGMFSKIYKDATDETKKAMIKSFTESGGTVLSTNWDEIGAKKTEIKPPEGMEFKKYEM